MQRTLYLPVSFIPLYLWSSKIYKNLKNVVLFASTFLGKYIFLETLKNVNIHFIISEIIFRGRIFRWFFLIMFLFKRCFVEGKRIQYRKGESYFALKYTRPHSCDMASKQTFPMWFVTNPRIAASSRNKTVSYPYPWIHFDVSHMNI